MAKPKKRRNNTTKAVSNMLDNGRIDAGDVAAVATAAVQDVAEAAISGGSKLMKQADIDKQLAEAAERVTQRETAAAIQADLSKLNTGYARPGPISSYDAARIDRAKQERLIRANELENARRSTTGNSPAPLVSNAPVNSTPVVPTGNGPAPIPGPAYTSRRDWKSADDVAANRVLRAEHNIDRMTAEGVGILGSGDAAKLQQLSAKIGVEGRAVTEADIKTWGSAQKAMINRETGWGDKAIYNQIPQKAAAIGATAWLVSKMSDSRGQMSNSELYGQNAPYQG